MNKLNEKSYKWHIALIIMNFVMAFSSTIMFIVFMKVSIGLWFFLNICAPTQYLTCKGLIIETWKKRPGILPKIAVPMLFRFGTGGFFLFPWNMEMMMAQISHIIMTITAIFILISSLKGDKDEKKKLMYGILLGLAIILVIDLIFFPLALSSPMATAILESWGTDF